VGCVGGMGEALGVERGEGGVGRRPGREGGAAEGRALCESRYF
jgi:hypothetical protein